MHHLGDLGDFSLHNIISMDFSGCNRSPRLLLPLHVLWWLIVGRIEKKIYEEVWEGLNLVLQFSGPKYLPLPKQQRPFQSSQEAWLTY